MNGLENMLTNRFQWLIENELKGNASKYQLLIISSKNEHLNIGASQTKTAIDKGY